MDQNPTDPKHTRFCVNNPRNLQERKSLIDQGFTCRDCLSNCTRCFETRFLEINDTFIEGDSYEQILKSAHPPSPPTSHP
ncbi:MAG: hypothetical protein ACSHX5_08790 [Phycisphaerales bacterium]